MSQEANPLVLKWGIVSTGSISTDFCTALLTLKSAEHVLQAVSARRVEDAQKFAERFHVAAAYGSYDELVRDPNVNIVYVGSIMTAHRDVCLKAIAAGKHVLCEKAMTVNSKEQEEILSAAKKQNVFFMEAIWTRFFPIIEQLKKEVDAKAIGEVKFYSGNFMVPIKDVERLKNKSMGGGGILDIGIYPIQLACLLFDHEKPIKITATGHLMPSGVDECCTIVLLYPNQRIAQINVSTNCVKYARTTLVGDKGILEIPDFSWCPQEYLVNGEKRVVPLPECASPTIFDNSVGLRFQAEAARQAIAKGLIEEPRMSHDHSRLIMSIMEEANRQLGNVYE